MPHQFARHIALPRLNRTPAAHEAELPAPARAPNQLLQLQQRIGNSGVRALLARQAAPPVQREPAIQRFWGDEESESDSGGSWLDDAADTVGGWFGSDEADHDSGGSPAQSNDQAQGSGGDPGADDSDSGSWWDQATDTVSDWFGGGESDEAESEDGEQSWWDELWESDESEGEDDEQVSDEPPREIPDISAECQTEDGVGHGEGKAIKLHGLTTSNYDHARPLPAPFPSGVKVTERKVKVSKTVEQPVFDASGTFDVTFASNPSISLPAMPSGLTPCQEKAVQAFISGPLSAHENDHKSAFETNYDGTFTATVSATNILDTPELRKRALENPVMAEDKRRADLANSKNKKLDPWKETVSGLDCKEPEKKSEETPAP